jgi:hypothetical protein
MAFILHVIDAPEIASVQAAESFISDQDGEPSEPNAKFSRFVDDITGTYPDLTEDDLDGDDERNVWEEGIADKETSGRVFELAVKEDLIDETVVAAIAHAALTSGLQLFDGEGMVLYRADHMIVDLKGKTRPF